jgi:predicted GIY-YIG superfamily endonuclease
MVRAATPGKPVANPRWISKLRLNNRGALKYVYSLESVTEPERHYVGSTDDLKSRFKAHNDGRASHTAKLKPWRLNTYIAFSDKDRAVAFEKYLKSHSGRAFARKRL